MSNKTNANTEDLLESLQALQDGAAKVAAATKRGPTAGKVERDRVRGLVQEHLQFLHEFVQGNKDGMTKLLALGQLPAMFLGDVSGGVGLAAAIREDQAKNAKPQRLAKAKSRKAAAPLPVKAAPKVTRRSARPAVLRAQTAAKPGAPVSISEKPLGQVLQVVVARGGNTYLHTFKTPPDLLAADTGGVLVIHGRFKLNPKGFIVG
jgi:hypothetical protein